MKFLGIIEFANEDIPKDEYGWVLMSSGFIYDI